MRHTVWLPTFGFKLRFNVARRYIVVDQHEIMAVVEDYIADSDDEDPAPSEQAYLNARSYEPARDVPAKCTHTLDASIKGLSMNELLERLSVPLEFQKAQLAAQLCESVAPGVMPIER